MHRLPNTNWIEPSNKKQAEWIVHYLQKKNHPLLACYKAVGSNAVAFSERIKNDQMLSEAGLPLAVVTETKRSMENAWRVHKTRSAKAAADFVAIQVTRATRTHLKLESKRRKEAIYRIVSELAADIEAYKRSTKQEFKLELEAAIKKAEIKIKSNSRDKLLERPLMNLATLAEKLNPWITEVEQCKSNNQPIQITSEQLTTLKEVIRVAGKLNPLSVRSASADE